MTLEHAPDTGPGGGPLDETAPAERAPVGRRTAATRREAREHATDPNRVEPQEAHKRAARQPQRTPIKGAPRT